MADDTHPASAVDDRIQREKQFHDDRFALGAEGAPRASGRFYVITGSSAARYEELIDEIPDGSEVLELGVGASMQGFRITPRVSVLGIDISSVAVELAAERVASDPDISGLEFREMNAEALDVEDSSFDAIIGSGIVHHLVTETAVAEFARALRPGGRAVFLEPMGYNPAIGLYRLVTPGERTPDEHPLKRVDFEVFRRHFDQVNIEFFHLTSLAALAFSKSARFNRVLDRLERVDAALIDRVPVLGHLGWFATIEAIGPRGK